MMKSVMVILVTSLMPEKMVLATNSPTLGICWVSCLVRSTCGIATSISSIASMMCCGLETAPTSWLTAVLSRK